VLLKLIQTNYSVNTLNAGEIYVYFTDHFNYKFWLYAVYTH